MKIIFKIPISVKKYMYIFIAAFILFILVSPDSLWNIRVGTVGFHFLIFPLIALLFIFTVIANIMEKKNILDRLRNSIWIISFAAVFLLTAVLSADRSISVLYIPNYLSGIFLVLSVIWSDFTYEKIKFVITAAAAGLFITAVYAIIQRIGGVAVNASYTNLSVNPDMPGRVESFFGNPNVYGFVLSSLLPIVAGYVFTNKSRLKIILGAVSFLCGTAALIMTYSRGCWFAFAAGMFIFVAMCRPKLIPVMLILGLVSIPFLPDNITNRILTVFNPNDTSISYRGLLMSCALRLIADHPIFGVGPGLEIIQTLVHQNYWPSDLDPIYRFVHSHNLVLQLWCEMGIFGCITFFGAVINNIKNTCRGFYKKTLEQKIFTASLISGMLAFLFCGISDSPLTTFRTMLLFCIIFGLSASLNKTDR